MALLLGVNGINIYPNNYPIRGCHFPNYLPQNDHGSENMTLFENVTTVGGTRFFTSKSSKGTPPEVEHFAQFTDHLFRGSSFNKFWVN